MDGKWYIPMYLPTLLLAMDQMNVCTYVPFEHARDVSYLLYHSVCDIEDVKRHEGSGNPI